MAVRTFLRWFAAGVVALALNVADSRAQPGDGEDTPPPGPVQAPGLAAASEVRLNVRTFGVAGRPRPGAWTGVEVEIDDQATKPRNVMIRIAYEDNDGDTAVMQRTIVSNPGTRSAAWLYLRLPFDSSRAREFRITATEAEAVGGPASPTGGTADSTDRQLFRPGRVLGMMLYRPDPRVFVDESNGLIGVIGPRVAGLEQYAWARPLNDRYAVTGHELTEIASGLLPQSLPDRWMGLSTMEALVWTGGGSTEQPGTLRDAQAEALREWVRRGGHLIVVLPPVAQGWIGVQGNPLADIMPPATVTRTENVDLAAYRSLITADRRVRLPGDAVVQTFAIDPAASPLKVTPIMAGPQGEVVAVRRQVGTGAVTVVGIDVASTKLGQVAGSVQAQVFWNRLLGKRITLLPPSELDARRQGKDPAGVSTTPRTPEYNAQIASADLDSFVNEAIANRGQTFAGLLLALIVFALYWLIAGPLGYYGLKRRGWKRHAWVAFLAAAAVFTGIAWTGANLLKIRRVQGRHLTFVDSVYGQTSQTALTFASLFLPRYGEQRVSAAGSGGGGTDGRNLVSPWEMFVSAASGSTAITAFPDARGYSIEAKEPDTAPFPARATAKEVEVRWAGALPAATIGGERMIRPLMSAGVDPSQAIRAVARRSIGNNERTLGIEGVLVHNFPGELTRVTIAVVREPTNATGESFVTFMAYDGSAVSLAPGPSGGWKANEALDLSTLAVSGARDSIADLMDRLVPAPSGALGIATVDEREAPLALSFYSQLKPPAAIGPSTRTLVRRSMLQSVDMSRWLNQPCVVVVGELQDSPCPVPITVDDLPATEVAERVRGRTIVRWIYPLPGQPTRARALPPPQSDIPPGTAPLPGE